MNIYTDDQSPPATTRHDEVVQYSAHSPSATAEFRNQAEGKLKVDENESKAEEPPPVKKFWRKPSDMPKRPMSSYNIFYRMERERLVEGGRPRLYTTEDVNQFLVQQKVKDATPKPKRKHRRTHGKISFTDLARVIASNWKSMNDASKAPFHERAVIEKKEYTAEIAEWNKTKQTPVAKGTARKAVHQKQEKSKTSGLSIGDVKDSNYELYSDDESNISNDATDATIRTTGVGNVVKDPLTGVRHINQIQYENDLQVHHRQEHVDHGRISTGMTFDSAHQHDDLLTSGGTLSRSRSLSDITDHEDLTLRNQRLIGQRNFSIHDQFHPPIVDQQRTFTSPRIGFSYPHELEIHNTHFLHQTQQLTASGMSQPHLYQMNDDTTMSQYASHD